MAAGGGAVITGLTGSISQVGTGGMTFQRIHSLSLNVGQSFADISAYGGIDWISRVCLMNDLNGSGVAFVTVGSGSKSPFGYLGSPSTAPTGFSKTGSTLTINFNASCSISFMALVGNARIVGTFEGLNIVTFDWARGDEANAPLVSWG